MSDASKGRNVPDFICEVEARAGVHRCCCHNFRGEMGMEETQRKGGGTRASMRRVTRRVSASSSTRVEAGPRGQRALRAWARFDNGLVWDLYAAAQRPSISPRPNFPLKSSSHFPTPRYYGRLVKAPIWLFWPQPRPVCQQVRQGFPIERPGY